MIMPVNRRPTHPGEVLKEEFIIPLKITHKRLADALLVTEQTISLIVNEKQDISANMALRLARCFSTTPEFWLNLQQRFDVWEEIHDPKAADLKRVKMLVPVRA